MSKSKNDIAWQKLFDKYNIVETVSTNGYIEITSTNINEFREARLMTKFDHRSQLPELFIKHSLSILPISRGNYVIGNFKIFHRFDDDKGTDIIKISPPIILESLNYNDITSEATAINCAFISGILGDFIDDENLYPTVSGRMSSSNFDFNISSNKGFFDISVNNSQVEIDGGFEGNTSLSLIEAKNYISDDFLVRQLYYPFQLWTNKINKKVRLIFLTYTNGTFHLREYSFDDKNYYNSINLIKQKKYVITEGAINIETIQEILSSVNIIKEPDIPFPQADSFERVINLCEILHQKTIVSKEELLSNYDFIRGTRLDKRQINYYTDAARYLGLIEKTKCDNLLSYQLTKEGFQLFKVNIIERQLKFVKLILSHSVFNRTLNAYLYNGHISSKQDIVLTMKDSKLYNIKKESTYFRRASTISAWINWIMNLIEE